jgi:hypothetical protein
MVCDILLPQEGGGRIGIPPTKLRETVDPCGNLDRVPHEHHRAVGRSAHAC